MTHVRIRIGHGHGHGAHRFMADAKHAPGGVAIEFARGRSVALVAP